jgi:hypothetical protein
VDRLHDDVAVSSPLDTSPSARASCRSFSYLKSHSINSINYSIFVYESMFSQSRHITVRRWTVLRFFYRNFSDQYPLIHVLRRYKNNKQPLRAYQSLSSRNIYSGRRLLAMPAHHAILIGIDAYEKEPLRGAVRDVHSLKSYLEDASIRIRIRTFTASSDTNPASSGLLEDPQFWPTLKNIQRAIHETAESAESGDFVYIHYSGHGTREKLGSRTYNESTGDLALVLLPGENIRHISYPFRQQFGILPQCNGEERPCRHTRSGLLLFSQCV